MTFITFTSSKGTFKKNNDTRILPFYVLSISKQSSISIYIYDAWKGV